MPLRLIARVLLAIVGCAAAWTAEVPPPPCNGDPATYHIDTVTAVNVVSWTETVVCQNTTAIKYCTKTTTEHSIADKKSCRDPVYTTNETSEVYCSGGSYIDNLSLSLHHRVADYVPTGVQSLGGCVPCGGGPAIQARIERLNDLPDLRLERFHRYRDILLDSSFGPGVFQTYDEKIYLSTSASGERTIDYVCPSLLNTMRFIDGPWVNPWEYTDEADGIYHNLVSGFGVDLRLTDATGALTTNQAIATTAVLTYKNGDTRTFQIIDVGGTRAGRITAMRTRTGAGIAITYRYAPGDDLGGSPARLWQINRVTDAYGRSLVVSYGAVQQSGRWAVSRIDLPTGGANLYNYQDGYLAEVVHANGDRTTITRTYDPAAKATAVTFDDPAATGTHRRKRAYLTSTYRLLPSTGNIFPQSAQLIRLLVNGDNEVTYLNVPHTSYTSPLIYEGGGMLSYDAFTGALEHRRQHATSWSLLPGTPITYAKFSATYEPVFSRDGYSSAQNDRAWYRSTPNTLYDQHGRKVTQTFDSLDRLLTRTYPDGTVERFAYNGFSEPTLIVDRLKRATVMTYDALGNRLSRTEGLLWNTTTSTADTTTDTATWTYGYALVGTPALSRLVSETDPRGNQTTYTYNAAGYLTGISEPSDAPGGPRPQTTISYTAAGLVSQIAEPGVSGPRVTAFTYDARNRRVATQYADTSTETVTYGSGAYANLIVVATDRNGNRTESTFDLSGRKRTERVTSPDGLAIVHRSAWTYDAGTDAPASRVEDGSESVFFYDYRHRLVATRTTLPGGQRQYAEQLYDTTNRPYLSADRYGRLTWSRFSSDDRVIRTVRELVAGSVPNPPADPTQVSAFLAALTRPTAANPPYVIEDATYDAEGQLLTTTDGRGTVAVRTYTKRGQLATITEASGITGQAAKTTFAYDLAGNRTSVTDARNAVTATTFTGRNLPATVTEAAGSAVAATTSMTYTITGRPATTTDARGYTTTMQYSGCCDRLTGVIDPAGFLTTMAYDAVGNRLSITDPNGLTTTTTYDARNRVIATSNGAGERTTIIYDQSLTDGMGLDAIPAVHAAAARGFLPGVVEGGATAVANPLGQTTYTLWDGLGRTVATIDALGHVTTVAYDQAVVDGGVPLVATTATDPLGHATTGYQDAAGRTRVAIDAQGVRSTAAFDAAGNRVAWRDGNGVGQNCDFDARNREIRCADTAGAVTTTQYDLLGNVVASTDALGATITSVYDLRNRRTSTTDRLGGVTRFGYDAVGNLLTITDAQNAVTTYTYNSRNLLASELFPAGQQTGAPGGPSTDLRSYTYDPGRRLATRIDQAGMTTTYRYDGANRLTKREYGDGKKDAFAYDAVGRLTDADSDRYAVQVDRAYDAAGRLTGETQTIGGTAYPIAYQYDADDRRTRLTYPGGSQVVEGRTSRDQLASVTYNGASVATRLYDDGGRLVTTTLGNGLVETRTWPTAAGSQQDLVGAISVPGVIGFGYTYDAGKRKATETDGVLPANGQTFAYDAENRLTSWSRTGGSIATDTQSWALSLVGDWNATTRNAVVENRVHTPVHEVIAVGADTLIYDRKGNLIRDEQGQTYTWDVENRLVAASVPITASAFGRNAGYRYDALGRRVEKTVNGKTTRYLHDGARVVREVDLPAVVTASEQASDGDAATAGLTPATGGLLRPASGTVTRINFQPETTAIPAGYYADKGRLYGVRTNGLSYGWSLDARSRTARSFGAVDLVELDTHVRMQPPSTAAAVWEIALSNGTYPVAVMMGDPRSTLQTDTITIEGTVCTDPDPAAGAGYNQGDFDGYTATVTVSDGKLTIAVAGGASDPKLCLVEIGPVGTSVDGAAATRLADLVARATDATWEEPAPANGVREYVYGGYVDEPLLYVNNGTKAYVHSNHLYSPAALTDSSGHVVERYRYDAYGRRAILTPAGMVVRKSAARFERGFTGYQLDTETGLYHARARMYSPGQGRFIGRDPLDYVDGLNVYAGWFAPLGLDPSGLADGADDLAKGVDVDIDGKKGKVFVQFKKIGDETFFALYLTSPQKDYECEKCETLQFIWRTFGNNEKVGFRNLGGTVYTSTEDPTKPNRNTDNSDPGSPLASGPKGPVKRTPGMLTFFDAPSFTKEKKEEHFYADTYLICGGKVVYHVHWERTKAADGTTDYPKGPIQGDPAGALPDWAKDTLKNNGFKDPTAK